MSKGPTREMWIRMIVILLCLTVGLVGVSGASLVNIMIFKSDEYSEKAAEQQLYDTQITPKRGDIYDTNMSLLATSATVWTVYMTPSDFSLIEDDAEREATKNLIADNLSSILSLDRNTVYEYTNKNQSYIKVKTKVEKTEADLVRQFVSDNKLGYIIGLDESSKRYYPNSSLASSVLGFVGDDNQGLYGIEYYYDNELTGIPGRVVAAKNARGADMPFSYEKTEEATPGSSLVLTIDSYIQFVCEKYLEQAVIDNLIAERGACIAMNVNSGEILAMSVKGDFDCNDPFTLSVEDQEKIEGLEGDERSTLLSQLRQRQWRNKAVSDAYEPGSVFKIITCAAALEEKVTSTLSSYHCPGYIIIAGHRYNCHRTTGHGSLSLSNAMEESCNPVFISMGQLLGTSTLRKYFSAFGLTSKTGIDLPGEGESVYHTESSMGPMELASTSFGQTFKVTPIQLLTAISAAVNGGYLVQPHVVKQILDEEGNITKNVTTVQKRQVISEETSNIMCQLLENVVAVGGGKNAKVAGYRIGGKTGTSEKVAENTANQSTRLYIGSFCGIAPMDDPEIAILILLDEPKGVNFYGGTIAAPAGGQMLADILPYMGYEAQYTDEEMKEAAINVPNVISQPVDSAKSVIAGAGLKVRVVGNGTTVKRQTPTSSQSIYKNGLVVLYTEDESTSNMVTVPNLIGMTLSEVNSAAVSTGINVEYYGSSLSSAGVKSYRQSMENGTSVEMGTVVTVYFRSESTVDFAG